MHTSLIREPPTVSETSIILGSKGGRNGRRARSALRTENRSFS